MASWRSTGMYVDAIPPPRANVVDGMWIFKVNEPLVSPSAFKARYVARVEPEEISLPFPPGAREWHDMLRSFLADLGFRPSSADTSLFVRRVSTLFFILVYVNDLVFVTADTVALAEVKFEL
ncbi:unnamed protein product [Closterium sp. NIES-53]